MGDKTDNIFDFVKSIIEAKAFPTVAGSSAAFFAWPVVWFLNLESEKRRHDKLLAGEMPPPLPPEQDLD